MTSVAGFEAGGQSREDLKELLTLFVVPVAYTLLDDLQQKIKVMIGKSYK